MSYSLIDQYVSQFVIIARFLLPPEAMCIFARFGSNVRDTSLFQCFSCFAEAIPNPRSQNCSSRDELNYSFCSCQLSIIQMEGVLYCSESFFLFFGLAFSRTLCSQLKW